MGVNRIGAAVLCLLLAGSLIGCSKGTGEAPDYDTGAQDLQTRSEISSEESASSDNADKEDTSKSETARIAQTADTADTDNAETSSSEISAAETDKAEATLPEADSHKPVPSVTEAVGDVPDSYREEGESGIRIIGRNGHYMGLMPCWGTLENCQTYADAMNKAAELLPNVNVYSMVIPTSSEFYTPDDMTGFTSSQKEKIDYIASKLKGAVSIDAYSALSRHTNEYIYSRTDHHWQYLGAYYAAEEFAKTAKVIDRFPHLSEYTMVTKDGYMGSLYNYSKSDNLHNDPEIFTLYISPNESELRTTYYGSLFEIPDGGEEGELFITPDAGAYYISVLGYGYLAAKVETDCRNGRTLVISKESYGVPLVTFLTECFETIYVCDIKDELDVVQLCKDVGATDLLFAVCTYTPADKPVNGIKEILG